MTPSEFRVASRALYLRGIVSSAVAMAISVPWVISTHLFPHVSVLRVVVTSTLMNFGVHLVSSAYAIVRMPVTARVSLGRQPLDSPTRLGVLAELRRFTRTYSMAEFVGWVVSMGVLGLVLGEGSLAVPSLLRLVAMGTLFGALAALLLSSWLLLTVLQLSERVAEGLSLEETLSIRPSATVSLKTRAVVMLVVAAAVPLIVGFDVVIAGYDDVLAVLTQGDPSKRAMASDAVFGAVATRLGLVTSVSVGLALSVASLAALTIVRPMQRLILEAQRLGQGRARAVALIAGHGEVERVTRVFAVLQQRLKDVIGQVTDTGSQLEHAAGALETSSQASERSASEQAAALNETSATTEELARSARQISSSAAAVEQLASQTLNATAEGRRDASSFQSAVERMRQDNRSIAAAVDRLQRRVQQIGRVVELINSVADRSDLLALSAELEGSRAGELGRGFALVGAEMRGLAENVLESTAEVEELIAEIREATVRTADATARGSVLTERGTALADQVTQALSEVASLAEQTAAEVRTITLSTQQQQSGTDQLAEVMAEILGATRGGLASTQRLAQVNQRLVQMSGALQEIVERFGSAAGRGR